MIIPIKAVFLGRNGSMRFKTGEVYDLWFFEKNGRYYVSRQSMDAIAIPYDTMTAFKKNWKILRESNNEKQHGDQVYS